MVDYSNHVIDKLQPHNIEAENATIGGVLIDPDKLELIEWLKPGMFYIKRNEWIYEAMLELRERGEPHGDLLLLSDYLNSKNKLKEIGGSAYLSDLINHTLTSVHTPWYARKVYNCAVLRDYIKAASVIAKTAYIEDPTDSDLLRLQEIAELEMFQAAPQGTRGSWQHMQEIVNANLDRLEAIQNGATPGLLTGIKDLDKLIGGVQPSDMVVLAGRPGMGKTALALQIMSYWSQNYGAGGMLSLEMSGLQLGTRMLSSASQVNSTSIRLGTLKPEEWQPLIASAEELSKLDIYIDDTPAISSVQLRNKAKQLVGKYKAGWLVVDYLQLMEHGMGGNKNPTEAMTIISNTIKQVARQLNIPILALSQLSRAVEARSDKRPILSDLRQSGSIEQDGDIVIFMFRDEVYNPETQFPNLAELIVSKFRHGPTGDITVYFRKETQTFIDLEVQTTQLEY